MPYIPNDPNVFGVNERGTMKMNHCIIDHSTRTSGDIFYFGWFCFPFNSAIVKFFDSAICHFQYLHNSLKILYPY